ncbi:MAG: TIM barrel protein [Solirubrobacterales bacterium]
MLAPCPRAASRSAHTCRETTRSPRPPPSAPSASSSSNPQGWEKPPPRDDADELKASEVGIYVHAPYLINVCSPKPNVRYGSRKILQQTCDAAAEIGALAVIVHPGHAEDGIENGFGRWPRTLEMLESEVPVYLENTAGGRQRGRPAFRRAGAALGGDSGADSDLPLGFCFDTCHAHAAGEDLSDAVERARAITGGIDLMHVNDSRDPAGDRLIATRRSARARSTSTSSATWSGPPGRRRSSRRRATRSRS